ncbi:shikimate kinase-domain-containing protein [Dipodascopsis uninucleata]
MDATGNYWSDNASLLMIGMRGVGKSSLAFIAAQSLGYTFIDTDIQLETEFGTSIHRFISENGLQEYRNREHALLKKLLLDCDTKSVIACGAAIIEHKPNTELLKEFMRSHPVIHIICDQSWISKYLPNEKSEFARLLCLNRFSLFRRFSNFEFYNVSSDVTTDEMASSSSSSEHRNSIAYKRFLVLKSSGRSFLYFLSLVLHLPKNDMFSDMGPPELRQYTYSVSLQYPEDKINDFGILIDGKHIDDAVIGADCIEIIVDSRIAFKDTVEFEDIARYVGIIRRHTSLPVMYSVYVDDKFSTAQSLRIYLDLLGYGRRLAPDYLNIDLKLIFARQIFNNTTSSAVDSYSHELLQGLNNILWQVLSDRSDQRKVPLYYKLVGSWNHVDHDTADISWWTTNAPNRVIDNAKILDCCIVRISKNATHSVDNYSAVSFYDRNWKIALENGIRLCVFNSGYLGKLSQILNPTLTPAIPIFKRSSNAEYLHDSRKLIHPVITTIDMQKALYSSYALTRRTFYVFNGMFVTKTLSPLIQNAAFKALGIPHIQYIYQTDNTDDMLDVIRKPDFGGMAVSLPHKRRALSIVDDLSYEAEVIGSVNTIVPVRKSDNDIVSIVRGENTDWIGIYKTVESHLSPMNFVTGETTALVIGAGASARASIYALIHLGVSSILIQNRTISKAIEVADWFNGKSPLCLPQSQGRVNIFNTEHDQPHASTLLKRDVCIRVVEDLESTDMISQHSLEMPTIIIFAISVNSDLPDIWLTRPSGGVVMELYYDNPNSLLQQKIRKLEHRGWIAVNGITVFSEVTSSQFEIWTNKPAPRRVFRETISHYDASM